MKGWVVVESGSMGVMIFISRQSRVARVDRFSSQSMWI